MTIDLNGHDDERGEDFNEPTFRCRELEYELGPYSDFEEHDDDSAEEGEA